MEKDLGAKSGESLAQVSKSPLPSGHEDMLHCPVTNCSTCEILSVRKAYYISLPRVFTGATHTDTLCLTCPHILDSQTEGRFSE